MPGAADARATGEETAESAHTSRDADDCVDGQIQKWNKAA